jgi:hypothetical protein
MDFPTKIIPVELSDGTIIKVEVTSIGEQRVAFQSRPFKEITNSIKSIANELAIAVNEIDRTIQPDKVSVKVGLEVSVDAGKLTTLIVKGAGKANLEITMEWSK